MGGSFVIVSLKHTNPRDPFVSFWRPRCAGYCWPLSWAGLYGEEEAREIVGDGHDSRMVPWLEAVKLAATPKPGLIDGNAGPVVTRRKMRRLLALSPNGEAVSAGKTDGD